jgi:hypothetical protein
MIKYADRMKGYYCHIGLRRQGERQDPLRIPRYATASSTSMVGAAGTRVFLHQAERSR